MASILLVVNLDVTHIISKVFHKIITKIKLNEYLYKIIQDRFNLLIYFYHIPLMIYTEKSTISKGKLLGVLRHSSDMSPINEIKQ